MIIGNHSSRTSSTTSDPLGRWSTITLSGRFNRKITVITAYQPCPPTTPNTRVSSLTTHAQQVALLRLQGRTITPRQAFIQDLRAYLRELRSLDHGILLVGDFNEPLTTHYSGMTKVCSDFGLIDLMLHMIGRDDFPTCARGNNRRIDYILCDQWIANAALAGCYEPFGYRTKGDHRNISLDFDSARLFGNPTYSVAPPPSREFHSTDRVAVHQYIDAKFQYLEQHSFETRLQRLQQDFDPALAEQLDRDLMRASFTAAQACRKKPHLPFVRKLATLRNKKNILLRLLSQHRLGMAFSASIQRRMQYNPTLQFPSTLEDCQLECRKLQQEIRKLERSATTHRRDEQMNLLREAQLKGDIQSAKQIKHRIRTENRKNMFAKFRSMRGTTQA